MRVRKTGYKTIVFLISIMFALDVYEAKTIKLMECELTEQYKQYLKLSEEEKKDVLVPPMCVMPTNLSSTPISSSLGNASASSFDLRTLNKVTPVKDQGAIGSCWAFATVASMESNALVKGLGNKDTMDLSEAHVEFSLQTPLDNASKLPYKTFNRIIGTGGTWFYSSTYLINRYGFVSESSFPYETAVQILVDKTRSFQPSMVDKPLSLTADSVQFISSEPGTCSKTTQNTTQIKNYLVNHGAIGANVNADNSYINGPYFYYNRYDENSEKDDFINHAVAIVGWNDGISKVSFSNVPSEDGAWIVKNSWGTDAGDNGYYYVSYEDKFICTFLAGFYDVSEPTLNENAYYHDYLGYNNSLTIEDEDNAYVAAVYNKATGNEKLTKVTTFFLAEGIGYDIYLSDGDTKTLTTNIATGVSEHAGYNTIPITHDNIITSNKFTIIIKYKKYGNYVYVPVSTNIEDSSYDEYEATLGETFLSTNNGTTWADIAAGYSQTAIVRGYTVPVSTPPTTTTTTTRPSTTTTTTSKPSTTTTTTTTTTRPSTTTTTTTTTTRPSTTTTTTTSKPSTTTTTTRSSTTTTKKKDIVPIPPNDDNDDGEIEIVPNPENDGITILEENPKTKDINKDGAVYIVFVCLIFMGLATYKVYKLKTEKI